MVRGKGAQLQIEVYAHWAGLKVPIPVGTLYATPVRGKEVFSFEYDRTWLNADYAQAIDPMLQLLEGQWHPTPDQANFGVFLDSSPDRWGRLLMRRREAQLAREQQRAERTLLESDYLLGVHDAHRIGALRFRMGGGGPFLDNNQEHAAPPWTSLRELEYASLQIEKEGAEKNHSYARWIRMLIAPGGSLGGARPKASVMDEDGHLWIAKFPGGEDDIDIGAWEMVAHQLAKRAGVEMSEAKIERFNSRYHTFLNKRFDRTATGERLHFASALTLLNRSDGDDASKGASYLELAEFIVRHGAQPDQDLEQLWRRIVFYMCISNTDDHLRNHGFILQPNGWRLSPAFDINPVASGDGLKLNVSESDNAQDLALAKAVIDYFRISADRADRIIQDVTTVVQNWRIHASNIGLSVSNQDKMRRAFRCRLSGDD